MVGSGQGHQETGKNAFLLMVAPVIREPQPLLPRVYAHSTQVHEVLSCCPWEAISS